MGSVVYGFSVDYNTNHGNKQPSFLEVIPLYPMFLI